MVLEYHKLAIGAMSLYEVSEGCRVKCDVWGARLKVISKRSFKGKELVRGGVSRTVDLYAGSC
jgi:hypothetical protein